MIGSQIVHLLLCTTHSVKLYMIWPNLGKDQFWLPDLVGGTMFGKHTPLERVQGGGTLFGSIVFATMLDSH